MKNDPFAKMPIRHQAVLLSLMSVTTIAAGTATGDLARIPRLVTASFSYLTSGMLLALVGLRLIPELFETSDLVRPPARAVAGGAINMTSVEKGGAALGFIVGAGLMVGMGYLAFSQITAVDTTAGAPGSLPVAPENLTVALIPPDKAVGVFPYGAIVAFLVIVLTNGVVIGITTDASRNVGLAMSIVISIELYFSATEKASLLNERELDWWQTVVVALTACGAVMGGAAIGSVAGSSRSTRSGAFGYYALIAFAVAATQSMISDAQSRAVWASPEEVWPSSFQFVGFFILLVVDWLIPKPLA
jgi:hypothetical protein